MRRTKVRGSSLPLLRGQSRWRAAMVVGALLFLQLSATLHFTFVTHLLCLEHGEAIHRLEDASLAIPDEGDSIAREGLGLRRCPPPTVELRHSHEHCLVQQHRQNASAQMAPVVGSVDWTTPNGVGELSRFFWPHGAALLRLAPKQSPPA